MTVELFGTARLRAGHSEIALEAETIAQALALLARDVPALSGSVILGDRVHPAFRLSLNGDRFVSDPSQALLPDDRLLLLSADVGG